MAVRTRNYLEVNLAPIVWKAIVEEVLTMSDLADVDESTAHLFDSLLSDDEQYNDDYFAAMDLTFSVYNFAGRAVALSPHGDATPVTCANRREYAVQGETFLITQLQLVASAIRAGLSTILPPSILRLMTGPEVYFFFVSVGRTPA